MKKKNELLAGQKNFYFQDYDYPENIKKPIISGIFVSFNRVSFVFFVFVIIALIYSLKIVYLASIDNENYFVNNSSSLYLFILHRYIFSVSHQHISF